MTQLLAASDRSRSACIRGSATTTIVPSSVDISCIPVIATMAMPSTLDDNGGPADWDLPGAAIAGQPSDERPGQRGCPAKLQVAGAERVLGLLGGRDLLGGVADQQRDGTDHHR